MKAKTGAVSCMATGVPKKKAKRREQKFYLLLTTGMTEYRV